MPDENQNQPLTPPVAPASPIPPVPEPAPEPFVPPVAQEESLPLDSPIPEPVPEPAPEPASEPFVPPVAQEESPPLDSPIPEPVPEPASEPFVPPVAQEESPPLETPKPNLLKRILPFILVILLVLAGAFVWFKFLRNKLGTNKEVTLTYWGLWEPEEVMKGIIAEWEKTYPKIKVNYLPQASKEYRERLQSALARNQGPDIFRFHITWVPMFKNELELVPGSVLSASQFNSAFYPAVGNNLRFGAGYLGLPLMIDNLALYYNEDIFRAAGKSPPTTWEELRQTAADLTVRDESGKIQTAGVALGTTNNVDHWSDILALMMLQNGADLTNPGVCTQQAPEEVCYGQDALTFYTIFNRNDRVWDKILPASTLAFASGKLAMYFGPSWRVFDIKAINPSLNFKIVPVPQLPNTDIAWATFWVEGVAKRSSNKKEAWEFLKFLSSPATLEKLYAAESNLRLFGEPYPWPEMASKLESNTFISAFIEQAPKSQTWYLCSDTFDNGINDRMIKYYEDAVNAVNNGETAKKAFETTGQGIAQLLSQYGISSAVAR